MTIKLYKLLFLITLLKINICLKCSPSNCPPLQGICEKNVCICSKNFKTVNNQYIKSYGINCNYQIKYKLIAFLLELFFPIGVGHIYAEKTNMAILKFTLFVIFILSFCGELCCLKSKINNSVICLSFIFLLNFFAWISIQIIDIVSYGLGYYNDGNAVPFI
jgi:hypothetical protein